MNSKTGFGSLSGNLHILDVSDLRDATKLNYTNSEFGSSRRTHPKGDFLEPIKKSKASVLNMLASFVLVLAFIFITLTFFVPFWVGFEEPWIERLYVPPEYRPVKNKAAWSGLLASCDTENVFRAGTDNTSGWHKVCQVLFGVGFVLSFSAVVVQLGYLCFKCRNSLSTTLTVAVAILITTATVLCGVCLGIYSGSSLSDGILTPLSVGGVGGTLAWAFYLGIAAVVAGGVASLMFYVDICFQIRKYGSYDASPQLSVI